MTTDSPPALLTSSQCLLLFCTCVICFSAQANFHTPLTIQTFLVTSDYQYAENATSSHCHHCFGLSPVEYGLAIGVSISISSLVILFSGAMIDLLGLTSFVILLTIVLFSGSMILAITPYLNYHRLLVAAFVVARFCTMTSMYWLMTLVQYVGIRYFHPRWQSFIIGIFFVSLQISSIFVASLAPRIATHYGVPLVFWSIVVLNILPMAASLLLCVSFRLRSDIVCFEEHFRSQKVNEVDNSPASFIIKNIKAFTADYWVSLSIIALTSASIFAYKSNVMLIQTTLFPISAVDAAQNLAYGWMLQIVAVLLLGYLLSRKPINFFVAIIGLTAQLVMYFLELTPHGSPLVSNLMIGLPYSFVFMSISPLFDSYVPQNALGLASTISQAVDCLLYGVVSIILGTVLDGANRRQHSLNALYVLIGMSAVQLLLLIILILRTCLQSGEKDEKQKLVD